MASKEDSRSYVEGYPVLGERARGALKLAWRLSQVEDDWTKGGSVHDAWDRWTGWPYMAKFTYDMTYTVRMLAKISQEVPAWRDLIGGAAFGITDRMRHYASWYDWVEQKGLDPNRASYPYLYYQHTIPPGMAGVYNAPGYAGNGLPVTMDGFLQSFLFAPVAQPKATHPYFHQHSPAVGRQYDPDPIRAHGSSNMMYKGYYMEQLAHGQAISADPRYEGPLDLIYDDEIQFAYTAEEISRTMRDQLRSPADPGGSSMHAGIDCEVGKAFPACISVGGLGMALHDKLNGHSNADAYLEWLERGKDTFIGGGSDPDGPCEWFSAYYDRDINYNMKEPQNEIPLFWTTAALQMSVHDRRFAERIYEGALKKFGRTEEDGALRITLPPTLVGPQVLDDIWATTAAMACAHELGDEERFAALQLWVDQAYEPTFADGEFFYGFNLNENWPRGIPNHILALTTAGGAGSFKRMYTEVNTKKFSQPTLCAVDYPNVAVCQAFFDETEGQLVLGFTPGCDASEIGSPTSFQVTNVSGSDHTVIEDGRESSNWRSTGDGAITIDTTVGNHTFIIR